jgi:hypothetical protein
MNQNGPWDRRPYCVAIMHLHDADQTYTNVSVADSFRGRIVPKYNGAASSLEGML